MRIAILVVAGLFAPLCLAAQADTARSLIEGRVRDIDGRPVAEAEIRWQRGPLSVLTRTDGTFSLAIPARGEIVFLVRKPGFNAQALRVNLSDRSLWRGEILLQAGSFRLPDIEVEARNAKPAEYAATTKYDGFFQRKRKGLGTFIGRDQIEKMNAFYTIEILRAVPGMVVNVGDPGDPSSADFRIPKCVGHVGGVSVWIDGQRLNPTEAIVPTGRQLSFLIAEQLGRVGASGIEMIEVYIGASQIPAEFHWNECAVVAIWTRWNKE